MKSFIYTYDVINIYDVIHIYKWHHCKELVIFLEGCLPKFIIGVPQQIFHWGLTKIFHWGVNQQIFLG